MTCFKSDIATALITGMNKENTEQKFQYTGVHFNEYFSMFHFTYNTYV